MGRVRERRRRGPGQSRPRPNAVRGNDWRSLDVARTESFEPSLPVTVVVSYARQRAALRCVLAALERQTYPRELLEVVVVDGSSRLPRKMRSNALNVRVVRQARRGSGFARARNRGARAARHDVLVFLDGDTVAAPGLVAAHARWHHTACDVLTLGFRRPMIVDAAMARVALARGAAVPELLGEERCDGWREVYLASTAELAEGGDVVFRAMAAANFAIGKTFYEAVGGCDESFAGDGPGDWDLAWRVRALGGVLVPARDALAGRLGAWSEDREPERGEPQVQDGRLASLIPHRSCRAAPPGRTWAVPRHVVTVAPGSAPAVCAHDAAERLLADPAGDLAVRVEPSPEWPAADLRWLAEHFEADPRVRVAPCRPGPDEFPASPIHARVPAADALGPAPLSRLIDDLGCGASAARVLSGGSEATIVRSWALHRARRTGRALETFGAASRVDERLAAATGGDRDRPGGGQVSMIERVRVVWRRARRVRGLRSALGFARRVVHGIGWKLGAARRKLRSAWGAWRKARRRPQRKGPRKAGRAKVEAAAASSAPPGLSAGLGVEFEARGPRAQAVFAASRRSAADRGEDDHVDVVLADTAALAAPAPAPAVVLDAAPGLLAVPGLDPLRWNPVGWAYEADERALALGPVERLPEGAPRAIPATLADPRSLRHGHHLEDTAAFHADPLSRAAALVRVAATGLPVRLADGGPELETLLGPELHGLMTHDIAATDAPERESLSVRARRAALRTHSLGARARQVCEAAGLDDPPHPLPVSILLPTRRPGLLHWALANVARQSYPNLELVLALHGEGFAPAAVEAALGRLAIPVKVVRVDADRLLGTVLNAATAAAAGVLVTKMDDDDLYGADHVWDLVLAREYTGATLVGKRSETVYLAGADRTLSCFTGGAERCGRYLNGGCLLIGRDELARIGGWRRVPAAVDRSLIEDVARSGGFAFRTHGAGYVLIRHGAEHTWPEGDAHYRAAMTASHRGWCPVIAGIDGPLPPRPEAHAFAFGAAS